MIHPKILANFVLFLCCFHLYGQANHFDFEAFDEVYEEVDSMRRIGEAEQSLGGLYQLLGYLESNEFSDFEYYKRLSFVYQDLSFAYMYRNDSLTFLYVDKAINAAKQAQDTIQITQSYFIKYSGLYEIPERKTDLLDVADSAIYYAENTTKEKLKMEAYLNMADVLADFGKVEESNRYLDKGKLALEKTDRIFSVMYGHSMLGNIYARLNNNEAAVFHNQESLRIAEEFELTDNVLRNARNLAEAHYQLGNYREAADYALTFADSTEIVYEQLIEEDFAANEAKYNTLKKDKELADQALLLSTEKTNRYRIIFIGIAVLGMVFALFQWLFFRQRKRKQRIETELKKEKELNDLRTTFLENIAHEIRTPITLINGHLDLALEKTNHPGKEIEHIKLAKINSKRILSNANEILELLKLEKGELPLQKEEIKLDPFFRRIFYSFESLAELKGIDLIYESNLTANQLIESDSNRLEKIISNYISNAIKFSPQGEPVKCAVNYRPNDLLVAVTDHGPGIAEYEHDKVFTRFYQSAETTSVGGVGVGLSIAKEYADSLGGNVAVDSSKGTGATFTLSLPVKLNEKVEADQMESIGTEVQLKGKLKIDQDLGGRPNVLIVEDNPEMNAYLSEILGTRFNCEVAFDGLEALKKVQNKRYQLVVSDVMMPQMDGIELKEKINQLPNFKTVPFIFITAKAQMTDRLTGYSLGVDDYIIKPFVKEELIARISNILSTKRERELWLKDNLEFIGEEGNAEEQLMEKMRVIVIENLHNEHFKVGDLAAELGYSSRQLSRLSNKMMGMSPVQYILELRLKKAHLYLVDKKYVTLNEVRNSVGIASASYFNKKFFERFGLKPSEV